MIKGIAEDILKRVYDFSEMTNEELRCKFFQKLEECIELCNNTSELVDWIKNEGVDKEVNELLNEWLDNGILENLINIEKFNNLETELTTKIDKNTNNITNINSQIDQKVNKNEFGVITEEMLTQSLKEKLVEGGNVAVVGTNSVGFNQFATDIQNDIGEWIEQTVNLNTGIGYDPATGQVSSTLDNRTVSFELTATSGDKFDIRGFTFGGDTYKIMFIDSSNTLISSVGQELSWGTPASYQFTCPPNTVKIRVNTWVNNAVKIVKKFTYLPIATKKEVEENYNKVNEEKIDKLQGVGFDQFNATLQKDIGTFKKLTFTESEYAYAIDGNNKAIKHTSSGLGNGHFIIDVNVGEIYKLTVDLPPSISVYGYIFTDENMNAIDYGLAGESSVVRITNYEVNTPIGAKKLIVSYRLGSAYIHEIYKLTASSIASKAYVEKFHPYQIPDFYESHVNEKIKTIKGLENGYGSEGETIAFITDIHYPNNNMYSFPILKKLIEETNISYVICGGDSIRDNADLNVGKQNAYDFMKIVKATVGNKFVTIYGNHDNNSNQTSILSPDEVYSTYFKHQENIVNPGMNKLNGLYWYLDSPVQKIRYIGLNTFEDNVEGILSVAQMKWLCEVALALPSDGWSLAFFTHKPISPLITSALSEFRQIIRAIRYQSTYSATYTDNNSATYDINVNFVNKKHSVLFVATGHNHYDKLDVDNNIGYFMSTCDGLYKDNDSVPPRTGINMQSFDIITINKKTNTVNLTKIGAGEDRSFEFANNN